MTRETSDVVVIGGGLAGLTAANRCAEQGLTVAVLEAGSSERYLCNSRITMGVFHVAYQNTDRDPDELRAFVEATTCGTADPALVRMLCHNVDPAVTWLKRQGVRTMRAPRASLKIMLAPPAAIGAGLRWPGRGGDQMLRQLTRHLINRRGRLLHGTRVTELMMSGKRCIGVVAGNNEKIEVGARATVIADGGFQANPDLLRRFISPAPEKLLMRNAKTSKGDGVTMAMAAGADVRGMATFYGHVQAAEALHNDKLWPYPTADFAVTGGIVVDSACRRIMDEGLGPVAAANIIARQQDPLGTFAIFDHTTWMEWAPSFPLPSNPLLINHGAKIYVAATFDDLSGQCGLAAEKLTARVAEYNEAISADRCSVLTPPRSVAQIPARPIVKPPFYAIRLVAGVTYTSGGIAIDDQCRVVRADNSPIEGLFAAGTCTGGLEGGPHDGYVGGLSKAVTTGWLIGKSVPGALVGA